MERLPVVLTTLLLFGGVGALGVWWVAGQRALHRKRDFKGMIRRRRELWQKTSLVIAGVLFALAFLGAAYVFARGGALR